HNYCVSIATRTPLISTLFPYTTLFRSSQRSDWLRGPSLLTALENLPLHTWSATIQGEMLRLLQGLAWLYNHEACGTLADTALALDRKSTRLNSSHVAISYAVFCLKKKN